jgi:hypothetical protein
MQQRPTLSSSLRDSRELLDTYAAILLTMTALTAICLGQWRLGCLMLVFTIPVYLGLWVARQPVPQLVYGTRVPTAVHPTYVWVLYEADGEPVATYTDPLPSLPTCARERRQGVYSCRRFRMACMAP